MNTAAEKQALQNFADKFGMTVHIYYQNDRRKKDQYFLNLNNETISPDLDYMELNHFLLGWDRCLNNAKN